MTTTNDLQQAAVANRRERGERWGVSTHVFANGDTVYCSVHIVAGRSITARHDRTSYGLKLAGAEYAKPTSREKVSARLKAE